LGLLAGLPNLNAAKQQANYPDKGGECSGP